MTIGIVGLGLIGGSFAKAYSDNDEHKVLAYNRSKEVIQAAYNDKAIDGELNEGNINRIILRIILCVDFHNLTVHHTHTGSGICHQLSCHQFDQN